MSARKPSSTTKRATRQSKGASSTRKASRKTASAKKATTRKATAKKPAKKTATRKPAAKKATTRKAPAKKTAKKAVTRKAPAKKTAARKPAKKPAPAKAPAKKPARKTAAKKAAAKRPAPKKTAARKPAKKTAAKKAPAKKAPAKKVAAKKVAAKTARKAAARAKAPARKPAGAGKKAPARKQPAPAKATKSTKPRTKTPTKKAAPAAKTQQGSPSAATGRTSSKKGKRPSASPAKTTATKKATTIETETPKPRTVGRKSAPATTKKIRPKRRVTAAATAAATKKAARARARARDGRQPGQAMRVPPPKTDVLVTADLPDIRRAAIADERQEGHRGHLQPEAASQATKLEDWEEPVDASLMMSALAVDVSPKIEDNYDYSVLEEFEASKFCPRPTRMVNTACGGGEASVHFAKRGFRCVGIDSDRSQIGLARERAWLAGVDIDFMVGDLFETPNLLPGGSFGLAIDRGGFSSLEDNRERQRYLGNIRRLLFEGGIFVLSAGYFPFEAAKKSGRGRDKADAKEKILLAHEGGVVVGELRRGGFDLMYRVLRKTHDSGELAELILYLRKP